jgi:hypothetical protein
MPHKKLKQPTHTKSNGPNGDGHAWGTNGMNGCVGVHEREAGIC